MPVSPPGGGALRGARVTADLGKYEELFALLERKYAHPTAANADACGSGPKCFLDIDIDGVRAGRVEVELFADKVPKTAENFRLLCAGAGPSTQNWGKERCLRGCAFHRVVPGFVVQSGDFTRGDGCGGESAWGHYRQRGKFADEAVMMAHSGAGLLSMANSGKDTNGSQFFITLRKRGTAPARCASLDGRHTVFGRVTSGFDVADENKTLAGEKPVGKVVIADCGEL
ncbi:cyclophilin-like domain-containing protein, partial [Pelagophyceae sp. CCMP2097]